MFSSELNPKMLGVAVYEFLTALLALELALARVGDFETCAFIAISI